MAHSTSSMDNAGKLTLRLSLGVLILLHGIAKITNPGSMTFISGKLAEHGLPELLAYGVYVGEIIAPLLVILGIYTRFSALVILVNMLFAIGLVHMHEIAQLTSHGGWAIELQACYLFGALALVFLGSGRYAARPD